MLIIYDATTGEVVDNTGTCDAWPDGGPEDADLIFVNTDARGLDRADLAVARLQDDDPLIDDILAHAIHINPATGKVVVGAPFPTD